MSKEAFNIEGLGKKGIDNFWELNFIRVPSDIFNLNYSKIEKLEGWGKLSINNLKKAVEKSKSIASHTIKILTKNRVTKNTIPLLIPL